MRVFAITLVTFLVATQLAIFASAQNCASFTSCSTCTANATCGWCGPTQQCFEGNRAGPNTPNKCYGSAWFWGQSSCPNCASFTDCKTCLYMDQDCAWCSSDNTCVEWGTKLGCSPVDSCPCDVYGTCSECLLEPTCKWCNDSCLAYNDASCTFPAHSCPCADNNDCNSCFADSEQGCVWCENAGGAFCASSGTAGCFIAHNCNQYCETQGTNCDQCNVLPGCAWCEATSSCVDASVSTCLWTHSCPNCGMHRYCDPCQDTPGCVWCENGECRRSSEANGCFIQHTCNSYCQGYPDCPTCNAVAGCGWCEESASCVDADRSTCLLAHSCSDNNTLKCGFDGGAFVGGMFLGIGLVAIGVGGYLFYRWKVGGKGTYRELH